MKSTLLMLTLVFCVFHCTAQTPPGVSDALEKQCRSVGGTAAWEKVQEAQTTLENCLDGKQRAFQDAGPGVGDIVHDLCSQKVTMQDCLRDFSEVLLTCFKEGQRSTVYIWTNSTYAALDYMCYNDGERLISFFNKGGIVCFMICYQELQTVMSSSMSKIFQLGTTNDTEADIVKAQCLLLDQMRTNFTNVVQKCNSPESSEFIDGLVMSMEHSGPCRKYYLGEASTNHVNHVLICFVGFIAAMATNPF